MTCAHIWPDELTPDAVCIQGCGQTYADWSERQAPSLITSCSSTTANEVPA